MPFSESIGSPADFVQQTRDFMNYYFDGNLEGAWMCAFYGDPGGTGHDWSGMSARYMFEQLSAMLNAHRGLPPNLYWSPYRYRGGIRGGDNFLEAVAVVVDDVGPEVDVAAAKRRHELALQRYRDGALAQWKALGADQRGPKPKPPKYSGVKIGAESLRARLGDPTTRLLTSPGNEQWFYRLDPACGDKAKLRTVLLAIGSDARDLARVMRAPGGANWKQSVSAQPHEAFVVELLEHELERRYNIDDIIARAGLTVEPDEPRPHSSSGEEKLEFQALLEAGLLLGSAETSSPDTKGSMWMICPGHYGGEDEGGWQGSEMGHSLDDAGTARVWPHGGFKCFHDSCRDRRFNDLGVWLEHHPGAGPIFERLKSAQASVEFSPLPVDEDDDEDIIGDVAPRVIYVRPGELPFQVREAVKALRARGRVYYYGRKTVEVIDLVERDGIGGKVRAAQITRLFDNAVVQRLLERTVDWWKYDGRSHQDVRCNVPPRVATNICNSVDLDFEEITGTIRAPFLRHDGTIGGLKDGYDHQTGLWVDHAGTTYPPVQDADCTKDNAQAALARLKKVLSEYRFSPSASEVEALTKAEELGRAGARAKAEALDKMGTLGKTVALSALLTPLMRPAVVLVPMFGIDAPIQGSGKTKLALSIAALMTGLAPALVQGTNDSKELDKRVNAALLTGEQCVVVDNLVGKGWGSSDLCAAITAERIGIRPLGTSDRVPIKNTFIVFLTGNNLVIEGDAVRRILVTRIDPNVSRPERERHTFDPVDYVRKNRADLVHDGLVILRAYFLAGRPKMNGHEIGSFGAWARILRDALMWLGEPDVAESIDLSRASNTPELEALLPAWEKTFGEGKHKARKAKDLLGFDLSLDPTLKAFGDCMRDHVLSTGPDKKFNEAAWLGTWLGQRRDQRVGELKLQGRTLDGVTLWYVSRVGLAADEDDDNPID